MAEYHYEATGPAAANGWQWGRQESVKGAWHVLAGIAQDSDPEFAASVRDRTEAGTVEHDGTRYAVTRLA